MPTDAPTKLKINQAVQIRSATEILATLDSNGQLDGLPFMPQMVNYCGRSSRVTRWVNNVCFQVENGVRFGNLEQCVLLDVDRCDGSAYGDCQMACPLFWHTNWLQRVEENSNDKPSCQPVDESDSKQRLLELATQNVGDTNGVVVCQATQLHQITQPRSRFDLKQYSAEINLNRVSASSIASSFCSGMLSRISGNNRPIVGSAKRTPVSNLGLQPGDHVTVKTQPEIIETLNAEGKNRGLWFDPVMLRYCGQTLQVSKRIDRLVDESTGALRQLKTPSVVLEDLQCSPQDRRFCSRLLHLFWREIWLNRA